MTPSGNPWTSARGLVFYRDGKWWASVTNWHGKIVWGDHTGPGGFAPLIESTHRMTAAVRLMDGIGQGKRLKRWSVL